MGYLKTMDEETIKKGFGRNPKERRGERPRNRWQDDVEYLKLM